jgi:hypothetical protein
VNNLRFDLVKVDSDQPGPNAMEAFEANNGTFTVAGHGLLDHVVATLIH